MFEIVFEHHPTSMDIFNCTRVFHATTAKLSFMAVYSLFMRPFNNFLYQYHCKYVRHYKETLIDTTRYIHD